MWIYHSSLILKEKVKGRKKQHKNEATLLGGINLNNQQTNKKTLESSKAIYCFKMCQENLIVLTVTKMGNERGITEPKGWKGEQRQMRGEKVPEKLEETKVRLHFAHKLIFCFQTPSDEISKHIFVQEFCRIDW